MGEAQPPRWPPPVSAAQQPPPPPHQMYLRNVNANMHGYPAPQYYPPPNSGNTGGSGQRRRGGGRGGRREPPPCLVPYPHYYPPAQGPPLYHMPVYQPVYCPYAPYYPPEYYDENVQEAIPGEEYYQAGPYPEPEYFYPPMPAVMPTPRHTFNVHAKNFVQHVHSTYPPMESEVPEQEMHRLTIEAPLPPVVSAPVSAPVDTPAPQPVPPPVAISLPPGPAPPPVVAPPQTAPPPPATTVTVSAVTAAGEPERIFVKQQINASAPPFNIGKVVINSTNSGGGAGKTVPPFSSAKYANVRKGQHVQSVNASSPPNNAKTPSEPPQRSPSPVRAPPPTAADFPPPPAPRNAPSIAPQPIIPAPQPAAGKSWASLFSTPKTQHAPVAQNHIPPVAQPTAPSVPQASAPTANPPAVNNALPSNATSNMAAARVPSNVPKPVAKVSPFDASPSPAPSPFYAESEPPTSPHNVEKTPTVVNHSEAKTPPAKSPTAKTSPPFAEKSPEVTLSYSEKTAAASYSEKTSNATATYSGKAAAGVSYSEKTSSSPSYSEKLAAGPSYSEKTSAANVQVRATEAVDQENKQQEREVKDESITSRNLATLSDDPASFRIGEMLRVYKLDYRTLVPVPRGLSNRSNLCYANAVLQALMSLPPFYNLMRAVPGRTRANPTLLDAMVELCVSWAPPTPVPANPPPTSQRGGRQRPAPTPAPLDATASLSVLQALRPQMAQQGHEHKQEDAEEFLTALLNELTDEMVQLMRLAGEEPEPKETNEVTEVEMTDEDEWKVQAPRRRGTVPQTVGSPSPPSSPLTELLRGSVRARTHRAHHATDQLQPFFTLPIDIQRVHSVLEALEQLSGGPGGGEADEPWQQTWLERLPPVLCLHLKCFKLLRGHTAKIIQPIDYPLELQLHSKMLSPSARGVYTGKQRHYRLHAVIYHEGADAAKGHYLTDAVHPQQGWIRYDDSSVSNISETAVLKPRAPRMPYILLYRRLDTIPAAPKANRTE